MGSKGPKVPSYATEISQMLYVFGEVKNPDESTVRFIEEVVRGQVAELVVQARTLAQRRGSRMPTTEDLIFLIRHDRSKVNRLKTYLGWKDVRKRAREDGEGGEKDIDAFEEQAAGGAGAGQAPKGQMLRMKIPWDIATIYGDVLPEDEDDEDVDEIDREAYEASKRLLKEADELTSKMTKEEYAYYSECRQASFTYRKAKRFREFVGLANYLDGTPKDEVLDVLGFLACEVVRSLCERGLVVKEGYEAAKAAKEDAPAGRADASSHPKRPREDASDGSPERASQASDPAASGGGGSAGKRRKRDEAQSEEEDDDFDDGSAAFLRPPPTGLFTTPASQKPSTGNPSHSALPSAATTPGAGRPTEGEAAGTEGGEAQQQPQPPKGPPPPVRTPLTVMDVEDAYASMQAGRAKIRMSGMRNFTGGLVRTKVNVI